MQQLSEVGKAVVKEVVNLKWVRVIKIKRGGKEVVKLNEVVKGN